MEPLNAERSVLIHCNPNRYYSGINALTLTHLARHLTSDARYDLDIAIMAGAVRFAAECEPDNGQLFWSKATLGDLEVLVGTPESVKNASKDAIAKSERDWFSRKSSCAQLQLIQYLGFRRAGSRDAALPCGYAIGRGAEDRRGARPARREGPEDLAFCQAAAGGDLLFVEACQQRGVRCQVLLPFPEPEFISARSHPRPAATSGAIVSMR